jgi:hypothetical protein
MKLRKVPTLFGALFLLAAFAAPAYADTSVQTATSGGVFNMPAGTSTGLSAKEEIRTGVPIGDKALVAIKNQSEAFGVEDAEDQAVEEPLGGDAAATGPLYASASCSTNVATGFAPSDIHGAVGSSVLVVVTNVDIGVYNKSTCAIISRVALKTLFAGFAGIANQTLFDPRVLYDRSTGRFFVTAESRQSGSTDQYQYFAVSTSSTASAWHTFRFRLSDATGLFCKTAANSFWDYPSAGKSSSRWFITANDFPASGSATGAVLAINKAPSLTGVAPVGICFNGRAFNLAPPIVLDSSTQSVFLAPRSTSIIRYNHTAGATVGADTLALVTPYTIAAWSVPPDAVQPNGQKLDSLDGRFQSASLQSRDRIWNIHAIASGSRPLIRWYRLRRSTSGVLSTVTFQSSATSHLFNPSFVTNSGIDGSPAFIMASRTDPTCTSASCLAAMLTFSGPNSSGVGSNWTQSLAGTSTAQFATTSGSTSCNSDARGSCRWGDYSSITVDPNDAGRAWGFNQLISGTNQFSWFTSGREEIYNLHSGPE